MSGSPKHYQLEEDPQDQSTVEGVSAAGILDPPQGAEGGFPLPTATAATPSRQSRGGPSSEQGEGSSSLWALLDTEYLISNVIDDKVAELMEFLTLKYLMKESATTAEMLMVVTKGYEEHFPVIFREACQWMQLVFGIEVKEVAPPSHVHVLVPALGLAYDGVVSDEQIYPRTILLIMILSIIHTEGNRAPEEAIWEVLSGMGLYPGRKHCIYGEPRKVLTRDLVQEQYLACQEVPNSDPPRYEFLWGPRAHAETSAEAVLEFLGRLKYTTRKALPICQEQGAEGAEERDPCSGSTEEWRLGPGSGMGHIPVPHPAASVPRHF